MGDNFPDFVKVEQRDQDEPDQDGNIRKQIDIK